MATPFLGEIRMVSFNYPPQGWALCNGQTMAINQNQALFSLLGTTFGGNGVTNFVLPNLQGRTPMHMGSGYALGQSGGEAAHTLTSSEIPHDHSLVASKDFASSTSPGSNVLGAKAGRFGANIYAPASNLTPLDARSVEADGGGQPHNNLQPSLVINFVIALTGIFPSRS